MSRQDEHHEHRTHDDSGSKNRDKHPERIGGVLVLLAGAVCVIGYMLSLDPSHRANAVAVFFVAWVIFGLAIAVPLWREYRKPAISDVSPNNSDKSKHFGVSPSPTVVPTITGKKRPPFSEKIAEVTVSFGGAKMQFANQEGKKMELLKLLQDGKPKIVVTAKVADGHLLVDANLAKGVQLEDNQLQNKPENWDRNFDDSAIEIVDERGIPVFQLKYIDEHTAAVSGVFALGDTVVVATETGIQMNPDTRVRIGRIFKYPSSMHEGERN